jgi:all-trans-retinol 13,14-reductase
MKYDCIVIGAGVSGLVSAIVLAKNGRRVALLEKASSAGPLLSGFIRNGIFYDTGFHHAGGFGDGETGDVFLRYLGLSSRLKKDPADPKCFDIIRFSNPSFEFRFPVGYENIRESLHGAFPGDKSAVDEYLEAVRRECSLIPYLNLDAGFNAADALKGVNGQGLKEFLDQLTDNRILKEVLSVHCLLNGVPPAEQALSNYAYIVGPYYRSVNRIYGGGAALIKGLVDAALDVGVEAFYGREVKEISLAEGGAVCGVRLEDGDTIESGSCISTAHPVKLMAMVQGPMFRPSYTARLKSLDETPSAFILYGESSMELEDLSGSSIYLPPSAGAGSFNVHGPIEERPFNISSTCRQADGSRKKGFIAICPASIDETGEWAGSVPGKRPGSYKEFKKRTAERMLRHIEARCPEFAGKIKCVELSTPLTLRDYTNNPFGSMYGVKHRIDQYNPLPVTRLKGLYLAGQSIISPGILGAMISGFIVCGGILGHDFLHKELWAMRSASQKDGFAQGALRSRIASLEA